MDIKWSKYIPWEPGPNQLAFLMLPHLEAFFGGAAGGGKSVVLLQGALQYVDIPGYAALILRRTLTELKQPMALLDLARQWLGNTDARYLADEHTYEFPTKWPNGVKAKIDPPPAKLQFGYLGDYQAEIRYQGAAYQYCCVPETPVLMSDLTYKPIGKIRVGDRVHTLQGPKLVTRTFSLKKECVLCVTKYGAQIQGANHRFLQLPLPKVFDNSKEFYTSTIASRQTSCQSDGSRLTHESQYQGLKHISSVCQQSQENLLQVFYAYLKDGQNDFSKFENVLRVVEQLPKLFVPSVLFSLPSQPMNTFGKKDCLAGGGENVRLFPSVPNSPADYTLYFHSYDELYNLLESQNEHQSTQDDVEESFWQRLSIAQGDTLIHNPQQSVSYIHPYMNREIFVGQTISDCLDVSTSYLLPLHGLFDVCDITVQDSSHYITMCGLVNSNCGIDEVTHFENDSAPRYLFSRLRKPVCPTHKLKPDENGEMAPNYVANCPLCKMYKNLPVRFRTAANPGGPGHFWVKNRYKIEKSVVPNTDGTSSVIWVGKNKEAPFIPSKLQDNMYLDQKSYKASLQNLDEIRKQQLELGDWDISPDSRFNTTWAKFYRSRGEYFILGPYVYHISDLKKLFVTVDPAASTKEGMIDVDVNPKKGPSYTVISTWGLTQDFQLIWLHMKRFREEIPFVIDQIYDTYRSFKPEYVAVETNGLGIGPAQILASKGVKIFENRKNKDKIQNASNAIYRMKAGRVWFPESSPWLKTAMDEVFSWTGHPGVPDDIVDTLSDACNIVTDLGRGVDPLMKRMDTIGLPLSVPIVIQPAPAHSIHGRPPRRSASGIITF